MRYTKKDLGRDLKIELKKGYDIKRISKRCHQIFSEHVRELDTELYDLLIELFTMEDDPQFEYSQQELEDLAEKLLNKK